MASALETESTSPSQASRNGRSAAAEPGKPSSKKKIVLPIVGVLALILLFWAFQKWSYGRTHQSTDNAQVDGHIVPVLAKVGGYVNTVTVSENDSVKAGQLLVQLDDDDYRVRLQQAQADLAAAEATGGGGGFSGQAQSQVQSAAGQRAALDAQIGAARANANKAKSQSQRNVCRQSARVAITLTIAAPTMQRIATSTGSVPRRRSSGISVGREQ